MTQTQKNLEVIKAAGGIVKASDWTTGSGRYVRMRAIPEGAARFERARPAGTYNQRPGDPLPWTDRPDIAAFFEAHPRVQVVIALVETKN